MEQNQLSEQELAVITDITTKIKEACKEAKYTHLCKRVETISGLDYVVNRCIKMMSNDKIKLGMALSTIESEMEGIN